HPALLLTFGRNQTAIDVDDRARPRTFRELAPDPISSRRIDQIHQPLQAFDVESTEEVSRGGRIGDPLRPQKVQETLVLPEPVDVLQTSATCQNVVRQIEHVIRFVIRKMALQQRATIVDGSIETDSLNHPVDHSHASHGSRAESIGDLGVEATALHHRARLLRPVPWCEPRPDPILAPSQLLVVRFLHSKCPPWQPSRFFDSYVIAALDGHFELLLTPTSGKSRFSWA